MPPPRPTPEQLSKPRKKPNPLRSAAQAVAGLRGAPSVYNPAYDEIVERMRLLNLNDEELAEFFGVRRSTIQDWRARHESFAAAYARGGEDADARVTISLKRRAEGMVVKDQTIVKLKTGNEERYEVVDVQKTIPPDTAAAALWLGNRQRHRGFSLKPLSRNEDVSEEAPALRIVGGLPDE